MNGQILFYFIRYVYSVCFHEEGARKRRRRNIDGRKRAGNMCGCIERSHDWFRTINHGGRDIDSDVDASIKSIENPDLRFRKGGCKGAQSEPKLAHLKLQVPNNWADLRFQVIIYIALASHLKYSYTKSMVWAQRLSSVLENNCLDRRLMIRRGTIEDSQKRKNRWDRIRRKQLHAQPVIGEYTGFDWRANKLGLD